MGLLSWHIRGAVLKNYKLAAFMIFSIGLSSFFCHRIPRDLKGGLGNRDQRMPTCVLHAVIVYSSSLKRNPG